ncbi:hypothetical protein BATDEDRAFT_23048 [Batrachochytrium dendrobatidis JAM81]|uniref:Cytochrome b5 heme-binding domain-containing protein n=2 Tax=Batrachochytrium dendrobatidis TaxID=109871 RepID=F4NWK4_BATDJ|nr:uncharacterized protein BATDEDRAFT_23048 [Batrachochytrium dendrobatidis JAM81]EGF82497.1 hypothetical protein BATDEDRAFT_23048 [Batrachochytrium dendrobatidis JAM81]|eukprot:XP_006676692.1 hypothetical protein BATDEDRAFT_23048 [Batrachochytrium dendrobatidis JAM81]
MLQWKSALLWAAFLPLILMNAFVVADSNTAPPTNIPLLANFKQVECSFDDSLAYCLYWSVEDLGTLNETLHAVMVFNATKYFAANPTVIHKSIFGMWVGLGWGSSMLSAESLLVYIHPKTKIVMPFESIPSGYYAAPINNPNKIIRFDGMLQTVIDNTMVVEFKRPTRPQGSIFHRRIDVTAAQNHIYAFNPHPDPRSEAGWRDHHGDHRGAFQIVYTSGMAASINPDNIVIKRVHGIIMAITWMLIFPACIFYTRYFRSVSRWMTLHVTVQSVSACVGVFGSTILIITSLSSNFEKFPSLSLIYRPHSILGLVLVFCVFLQCIFGIVNRGSLKTKSLKVDRSRFYIYKFIHNWFGRILIVAAFFQVGIGLQVLYPFSDLVFHGFAAWTLYFVTVGFWTILFAGTEVYYQYMLVNVSNKIVLDKNGVPQTIVKRNLASPFPNIAGFKNDAPSEHNIFHLQSHADLQPYTWKEINENVKKGNLLVVANGTYVYSIDAWIGSHPGGQIILHSVAGTDITNDFFNDTGYDAEAFIPRLALRSQSPAANHRMLPKNVGTLDHNLNHSSETLKLHTDFEEIQKSTKNNQSLAYSPSFSSTSTSHMSPLDEKEWQYVIRARRTHVHTRLAMTKLSTLIVGRLASPTHLTNQSFLSDSSKTLFDPTEYRRYALVSSTLETTQGTTTPVYRLKFCLLYPYDLRQNEPENFMPGQCVQLQTRVNNAVVSRFYSPIKGNPVCFEIALKVYTATGTVSPFLSRQKLGERQFKIRGPFGIPIVHPELPLGDGMGSIMPSVFYDRLVLIGGGSGLVMAIQFIQTLLLSVQTPIVVWQAYTAKNSDEITLSVGDWVVAHHHYLDGWAEGVNLTTRQSGLFPLPVTIPRGGASLKIAVINATKSHFEIFGRDILTGALLAYPQHIQITHYLSRGGSSEVLKQPDIPGVAFDGHISGYSLNQAMQSIGWQSPSYGTNQRVVVCGSKLFQGNMCDLACGECGIDYSNLTILLDNVAI